MNDAIRRANVGFNDFGYINHHSTVLALNGKVLAIHSFSLVQFNLPALLGVINLTAIEADATWSRFVVIELARLKDRTQLQVLLWPIVNYPVQPANNPFRAKAHVFLGQ